MIVYFPAFTRLIFLSGLIALIILLVSGCARSTDAETEIQKGPIEMSSTEPAAQPTEHDIESFKSGWNQLNIDTLHLLDDLYATEIKFQDPIKQVHGIEALRSYFAEMYEDVAEIEFEFADAIVAEKATVLTWTMHMRHKNFRSKETVHLPGISHLRFNDQGKVIYHRDYFDLGHMIYERVPLLGALVRMIKGRL